LMALGDPIVLLVGGRPTHGHIPGIWAYGWVVQTPFEGVGGGKGWIDPERRDQTAPYVTFDATWLRPPLPRTDLVEHAILSQSEIVRMPRMQNPSFFTPRSLRHWTI
jgi:hypothetical protein